MKTYFYLFIILIFISFAFIIYFFLDNEPKVKQQEIAPVWFCGTKSISLDTLAIKGKELFNINCAACHSMHKKMTGPAIATVYKKYQEKKLSLHNYIIGERNNLQFKDFNEFEDCTIFKTLTKEEVTSLEKYIEFSSTN